MPEKILTDEQIVAALNEAGCPMTLELFQQYCVAVSTVEHQGTHERGPEMGADQKLVIPRGGHDGKQPLHRDNPYDEDEVESKRVLRGSIDRRLNQCHNKNKWYGTEEELAWAKEHEFIK